jgi:hypothetical protein
MFHHLLLQEKILAEKLDLMVENSTQTLHLRLLLQLQKH